MNVMNLTRVAVCVLMVLCPASGVGAQASQADLAREILSEDVDRQALALSRVREMGSTELGPDLRSAIITALARRNEIYRQRRAAASQEQSMPPLETPEFTLELIRSVVELEDPNSIPVLVGALGHGATTIKGLAAFGEASGPAVIEVATSADASDAAVGDALIALRFMIERSGISPLSDALRREIHQTAMARLTGEQGVTVLWRAIDLGAALGEPSLTELIRTIADRKSEVVARGVEEPSLVLRTQQRARDRLAGIPALPIWR